MRMSKKIFEKLIRGWDVYNWHLLGLLIAVAADKWIKGCEERVKTFTVAIILYIKNLYYDILGQ